MGVCVCSSHIYMYVTDRLCSFPQGGQHISVPVINTVCNTREVFIAHCGIFRVSPVSLWRPRAGVEWEERSAACVTIICAVIVVSSINNRVCRSKTPCKFNLSSSPGTDGNTTCYDGGHMYRTQQHLGSKLG